MNIGWDVKINYLNNIVFETAVRDQCGEVFKDLGCVDMEFRRKVWPWIIGLEIISFSGNKH